MKNEELHLGLIDCIRDNNKKKVSFKIIFDSKNKRKSLKVISNNKMKKLFNRYCKKNVPFKKINEKFNLNDKNVGDLIDVKYSKILKLSSL